MSQRVSSRVGPEAEFPHGFYLEFLVKFCPDFSQWWIVTCTCRLNKPFPAQMKLWKENEGKTRWWRKSREKRYEHGMKNKSKGKKAKQAWTHHKDMSSKDCVWHHYEITVWYIKQHKARPWTSNGMYQAAWGLDVDNNRGNTVSKALQSKKH